MPRITLAQALAAAALADLRPLLANREPAPHEGPAFTGSHNCLENIVRDYARRRRGHWFDADTMRFFGTRFPSGFLDLPDQRITLFVTTEKDNHSPRLATLRVYLWDSAEGQFCAHSIATADKARDLVADALKGDPAHV